MKIFDEGIMVHLQSRVEACVLERQGSQTSKRLYERKLLFGEAEGDG